MKDKNPQRILIIGNFGAGKSWLAQQISNVFALPMISMDRVLESVPGEAPKDRRIFAAALQLHIQPASWILEGAYADGATLAILHADLLLWLDLPTEDCLRNIAHRQAKQKIQGGGLSAVDWTILEDATKNFDKSNSLSSRSAMQSIFDLCPAQKLRFESALEASEWVHSLTHSRNPPQL